MTEEGLVNGAMGTVTELAFVNSNFTTVYVKFDDVHVGARFQQSNHSNSVPIEKYSQEFIANTRYIIREKFPLTPCWACSQNSGIIIIKCCNLLRPKIVSSWSSICSVK